MQWLVFQIMRGKNSTEKHKRAWVQSWSFRAKKKAEKRRDYGDRVRKLSSTTTLSLFNVFVFTSTSFILEAFNMVFLQDPDFLLRLKYYLYGKFLCIVSSHKTRIVEILFANCFWRHGNWNNTDYENMRLYLILWKDNNVRTHPIITSNNRFNVRNWWFFVLYCKEIMIRYVLGE